MEVPGGRNNKFLVCLHEFLGTSGLVMAINFIGTNNPDGQPGANYAAIPMMLFCIIYTWGGISGGHVNPAVTAAVFVKEFFDPKNGSRRGETFIFAIMIMVSQILGGLFSILIMYPAVINGANKQQLYPDFKLCPPSINMVDKESQRHCFPDGVGWSVFFQEFVATFFFVFFIMCVKYFNNCPHGLQSCMYVGIALAATGNFATSISGGCLNPAVAIAQSIYQYRGDNNHGHARVGLESMPLYFFGTLFGGLFAGIFAIFRGASVRMMQASSKTGPHHLLKEESGTSGYD